MEANNLIQRGTSTQNFFSVNYEGFSKDLVKSIQHFIQHNKDAMLSPEQTIQACQITCYTKQHETCLNGLYNPSNNSSSNSTHKKKQNE